MTERDEQWELNHLHTLIYDEIGMCGCGWSDDAYTLIRDLLDHFHDRDDRNIIEMVGSAAAAQIVLYRIQDADLIDHGTSVTSSWITDKGRYARWLMHKHPQLVEHAGYPDCWDNELDRCPDECWIPPADVPEQPPGPTMDELMESARQEAEAVRAKMNPAQRAVLDAMDEHMSNMLIYGQHPAPADVAGRMDWGASLDRLWNDTALRSAVPTGLFDALGGTLPGSPAAPTDPARVLDWVLRTDEAANGPLGRARWAPATCICPWPWPTSGQHVRLDCPHYAAPTTRPRGRNTRIGCQRYESGTWVHGDPHDCPPYVRGH